MSRLTLLPILLVLMVLVASPQFARAEADAEAAFAALDQNEDGRLSGTEMATVKEYDADGDERITKEEFLAGHAGGAEADAALFAERDVNEDGWLSGREVQDFAAFDADGDGEVAKAEFLAGRAAARNNPASAPGVEGAWHKVELAKHNLAFEMPAKPQQVIDEDGTENYRVMLDDDKYGLQARVMKHEANIEASAEKFLEIYARELAKNSQGKLIDEDDAPFGAHPGKVLLFELPGGKFYVVRAILIGNQSYEFEAFLADFSDTTEALAVRFLESPKSMSEK